MRPPLHRTNPGINQLPGQSELDAGHFVQAVISDPVGVQDAIDLIRVDEVTGNLVYRGIQRDVSATLSSHIGAVVDLIEAGTDRHFRYDASTDYAFYTDPSLADLWEKKRDAPTGLGEVAVARQIRLRRLQLFAGRLADPFGLQDYRQLRSAA